MEEDREQTPHLEIVKKHFEYSYRDYDRLIPKLVPGYHELKTSILDSFGKLQIPKDAKVLDLGCGTALLGESILEQGSYQYVGIDISEHMIAEARYRLEKFKNRIRLIQEDFFNLGKLELPKFDVITSMLAIHHFENKKEVYTLARSLLDSQKPFVLSDLVVDAKANTAMREFRKEHMRKEGLSEEEITRWFEIFDSEDKPSSIEENISLLQQAGFQKVTKVWNNENYATIVAVV